MEITLLVNAGGRSSRMGPWAPCPKPFLPIGPWDHAHDQGLGPHNIWRILYHFDRLIDDFPKITFSKAVVLPANDPASRIALDESAGKDFHYLPLHDPESGGGPMAALRAGEFEGGVLMHNADDLLQYDVLKEVVREAAGEALGAYAPESANVLAAARCAQFGSYGELAEFTNVYGAPRYLVKEKPKLANSLVGCGLLYLTPKTVQLAREHPEWKNSSVMLNSISMMKGGVELALVGLEARLWQTYNTPAEYVAACRNPLWQDAAWRTWCATQE